MRRRSKRRLHGAGRPKQRWLRIGIRKRTLCTMTFKRGDVVVVPFPFSEKRASKKRPALVISSDRYNASASDVIVAQITTRLVSAPRLGDHILRDWRRAGLRAPSLVRTRLATLHESVVLAKLGSMPATEMVDIDRSLGSALGLEIQRA